MKKTLVALAILTAAGSANAGINLYDAEGVKVDMSGAAEVQYRQEFTPNSDAKIRLDDGDLAINTTVAISDKMNAVAGLAFEMEGDNQNVTNDELWVGVGGDFGTLTFGRQYLIADDAGIAKDYELGGEAISLSQAAGNQTVKYVFDQGQFYAGVSALIGEDGKGSTSDETSIIDGRLGARFSNLDVRVYLYSGKDVTGDNVEYFDNSFAATDKFDVDGYQLEAEYVMDAFAFAASFGQVDYDLVGSTAAEAEVTVAALAGSYTMDMTTFALGYNYADLDDAADGDVNTFYANVTQQLHSNVKVYGEIGTTDVDNSEFGYVAGMEVKF